MTRIPVDCEGCGRPLIGSTFIYPERAVLLASCYQCRLVRIEELPELNSEEMP